MKLYLVRFQAPNSFNLFTMSVIFYLHPPTTFLSETRWTGENTPSVSSRGLSTLEVYSIGVPHVTAQGGWFPHRQVAPVPFIKLIGFSGVAKNNRISRLIRGAGPCGFEELCALSADNLIISSSYIKKQKQGKGIRFFVGLLISLFII